MAKTASGVASVWTRLRAIFALRQRHHAVLGPVAVAEEVPELDPVAGGVGEVDGTVTALVLDRAFGFDSLFAQLGAERVEPVCADGEGEVDVAAAAVGVLLLARRPDAEPAVLTDPEPDPVPVFHQQPLQPQPFVEALETFDVVGLQDQLANPADRHVPASPVPFRRLTRRADGYPLRENAQPTRRQEMSTIEESIEVKAPLRAVYNQWTQFEDFPRFMEGVEDIRQIDETHLHWVAEFGVSRHEWEAEITEQKP